MTFLLLLSSAAWRGLPGQREPITPQQPAIFNPETMGPDEFPAGALAPPNDRPRDPRRCSKRPAAMLLKDRSSPAVAWLTRAFRTTLMRRSFGAAVGTLALLVLASAAADHGAWSQTGRTIRIVLGVPPGGSIDFLARLLADQISTTTGQTMIVESKPGAGGIIAAEAVARAAPDGNTLLINNNGTLISAILRKVNYDPITSFEPICYLVTTPQIIVVNSTSPYRTLADIVDAARLKPGELSIASVGPNTTQHIGIERFKRLAGANLTYVPYPGGATTINALLGEHITAAVLNWSEIGEHIVAGKARALATMAPQRIEPLPDLPTVAESGYRDFETDVWFGVVAPAKTPKETVAQLIDWFRTTVTAPPVKAKLVAQALYPNPKCGADFDAHLRRQAASFTQLIHDLDFKAE
jgi:tripartite-type tricarboxylate transporter receptor subunit TctC